MEPVKRTARSAGLRGPAAPLRSFRGLEGPERRSTEPTAIPVIPSRSTWADLATINGIIQSDGFLSRGHRNAWSRWEGEGPAGCVFINQPPCPVVGSKAVPARAIGHGPSSDRAEACLGQRRPPAWPRLGQEQGGRAAWVASLALPVPRRSRAVTEAFLMLSHET